jgi:hypothetical protein
MNKYSIPTNFIPGFEQITKLTEEQVELFAEVFKNQKPGESLETIFEKSVAFLNPLSEPEIHSMITAMVSIVDIFERAKRDIDTFTSNFSESYVLCNGNATSEDGKLLKKHLSTLLSGFDTIRITSKAQEVILSNKNNFDKARIVSDIRIVFDDKIDDNKKVAVIVHNLKLEYTQRVKKKEFFIAMDLADLKLLKTVVDRAIQKHEVIQVSNHELQFIEIN